MCIAGFMEKCLENIQPRKINTAFIGGGTLTCIPLECFSKFLMAFDNLIGPIDEFTIEVNPESLTGDFLQMVKSYVQSETYRISMGVQTYNEDLLSWLGRPAGKAAIHCADVLANPSWFFDNPLYVYFWNASPAAIPKSSEKYMKQGILHLNNEQLYLDTEGLDILDFILMDVLKELDAY